MDNLFIVGCFIEVKLIKKRLNGCIDFRFHFGCTDKFRHENNFRIDIDIVVAGIIVKGIADHIGADIVAFFGVAGMRYSFLIDTVDLT